MDAAGNMEWAMSQLLVKREFLANNPRSLSGKLGAVVG